MPHPNAILNHSAPQTRTGSQAINTALALRQQALASHQRRLLLLEGEADWTLATAHTMVSRLRAERPSAWPVHWIGRQPAGRSRPITDAHHLLGSESELIIYDLFAGLDADALAAAAGSLRGGGLLLLLGPPLEQWPEFPDPAAARIATYPYRPEDVGHGFLTRMAALLMTSCGSQRIAQPTAAHSDAAPRPPAYRANWQQNAGQADAGTWNINPEQQQVIAAIRDMMTTTDPPPLVISAGRGRGKSTALGLAAAELLRQVQTSVLVTAPRYRAARTLLDQAGFKQTGFKYAEPGLRFQPPDQILREQTTADLLLVDEAAGIPAPLLHALLEHFPRIVFATTIQGYEGTGRGFALRFFPLLDRYKPGWQHLKLTQPVRYAANDPLETLINHVLLLDAEPARHEQREASTKLPLRIEPVDRGQLSQQEASLREIFGLLMLAHYQTRPSDLRHLLDGPNLHLTILRRGDSLFATALIAHEGGLDEALSAAIFAGERRPRGHLLPQTLCAHAGLARAPGLQYARIVRIAVQPSAQRQGHGRALLTHLIDQATQDGCDLIGASFGATADLLAFWHAGGFIPVQLGSHRNAATGAHAVVTARALTIAGEKLLTQARAQFTERLTHLLPGRLRQLDPALVLALLQTTGPPKFAALPNIPNSTLAELRHFAHHQRSLEASLPPLALLAPEPLIQETVRHNLSQPQAECFIALVLQQHLPEQIASRWNATGRADLIGQLRKTAAILLDALCCANE